MKNLILSLLLIALCLNVDAQNKFTREQVLNMTEDELMELSMDDFAEAIKAVGVSNPDELFAMIMNKNVSSASKEDEDSFRSPLSTTVITRQEMRTYGITTIEEAFRLIPGMIVTEKYNGLYDIQMRGLNNIPDNNTFLYTENANTLLMIDGRPVQNNVMGSINFDMLPIGIEDITRIEVVRGACGAIYGANAVNGVINIITERPSEVSSVVSGDVQIGNNNTTIGEVAIRKAFTDKLAMGVTLNMQRRNRGDSKLYLIPNPGQYIPTSTTGLLPKAGSKISLEEIAHLKQTAIDASTGGEYTLEQVQSMKQLYDTGEGDYRIFDGTEPETPLSSMFPDPDMSRETFGVNGYLCLTPAEKVNIFISGGYQKSHVNGSPCNEDIVAMNGRKSSTGYVNLDANIKGLHLVGSYMGGIQEYVVGVPGYKMKVRNINANVDYDFKLDCGLSIRPGFNFQHSCADDYVPVWDADDPYNAAIVEAEIADPSSFGIDLSEPGFRSNYKWHYEDPDYGFKNMNYNSLTGLFTGEKDLNTVAPSLRLDYKHEGLRLIAAYRADKNSNPDKWSHSWQLGASYVINDNNFVRFVYGRANRGTNLVNSCADYTWIRTNMFYPYKLKIEGNDNITLMHIDNFELGYRWRPTNHILIDAEGFYSISKDYGAMMANYGALQVSTGRLNHIAKGVASAMQLTGLYANDVLQTPKGAHMMGTAIFLAMASAPGIDMGNIMHPYANVKYSMLPYEVHQMGISMNMDYIISPKLIAKLNANIQKTHIDNYYKYQQIDDIKAMLTMAKNAAIKYGKPTEDDIALINQYLPDEVAASDPQVMAVKYMITNYDLTGEVPSMLEEIIKNGSIYYQTGKADSYDEAINTAAWEVWNNVWSNSNGICEFGKVSGEDIRKNEASKRVIENGYVHDGTPGFYGMLGMIYKPLEKLEVSAFCNYIGKRTYKMAYGNFDLAQRCTLNMKLGYRPMQNFEVYVNAHNLLNTKKREFVMNDRIGGLYTVGLTFAF